MSSTSTLVGAEHFAYVAERTRADDDFLIELKRSAKDAGLPQIWISPEQASLMQILLRLSRARDVVEVGTLGGYSAIRMARALRSGGRVRTIEVEKTHADFARDQVSRSDVAGRIEVILGAGSDVLRGFETDSADAIFIDADKAGYRDYLEQGLRVVRSGGLFMVDNAFAFGRLLDFSDDSVEVIRQFNDFMAGIDGLEAVIVPIGDGLWVGTGE